MASRCTSPICVRRFVLERHPIRGHAVRLARAWLELREHQDYPPAVQQLLGEAVGAVVLLAATLKFDGTLTLQLQGKGLVSLLVAQCTHDFKVRAMARHDADRKVARRVSARWRAKARSSSPSKPPTARPATRAWCPSPAIRWPNRSRPISCSPSSCRRACCWPRAPAWWPACWCSAFPASAARRRRSMTAALEAAWMKADARHVRRYARGTARRRHGAAAGRHVRRRRGARVPRPRREVRMPLLARARGERAALAGRRKKCVR